MTTTMNDGVTEPAAGGPPGQRPVRSLSRESQKLYIWAGVPMMVLLFGGLLLAHFFTPPSPAASAEQIAHMYRAHTTRIRVGLSIAFFGFILVFPYAAAISTQTRRIRGAGRLFAYTQNSSFASASLIFIIPWCMWLIAAYRPGRPASETQLLNDIGWIMFVYPLAAFCAWNWSIAAAILTDRSTPPLYPRWVGYYNIFLGLSFVPDVLVVFFKTGPFTWRGAITYYLPFLFFGIWMITMMITTSRAIDQETATDAVTTQEAR